MDLLTACRKVSPLSMLWRVPYRKKCRLLSLRWIMRSRHLIFLMLLLILVSGDVEVNPGPTGTSSASCIDIHARNTRKSIVFNCEFARVAAYEMFKRERGEKDEIDYSKQTDQFQALFKECNVPKDMFSYNRKETMYFKVYCEAIIQAISRGFKKYPEKRITYLDTFSLKKWKTMPMAEKKKHSFAKCITCAVNYPSEQQSFPLQPIFEADVVNKEAIAAARNATAVAKKVLQELNGVCDSRFGTSFTESLPRASPALSLRKTKLEKQQATREMKQKVIAEVEKRYAENVAISHLAEGESDASYNRKRKRSSFDPPQPSAKRSTIRNISPDKEAEILARLSDWQQNVPVIWSKLAKEYGITATNGGNSIKELARKHGFDVVALQGKPDAPRMRCRKSKLADGRTSVPCPPSISALKKQVNALIEDGTLDIGEPCAPSTVHTFKLVDGKLEEVHSEVYGRRYNMQKLREDLLHSQENLMKLHSDEEIEAMTKDDLMSLISEDESEPNMSVDDMKANIRHLERTRHLAIWHDHSSVLSHGYMLFTVNIVHDKAVFKQMDELAPEHKPSISLQEFVEEPRLCMIAICSSSADDQAALIPDRVDALMELSEPIYTSKGIEIHDKLRFFLGDKKAASFEQGTQCGGNYPCGFCGIHVEKHHDQAHALRRNGRSLKDIRECALNGSFGGRVNVVKPFQGLSVGQLQSELIARGCADIPTTKDKLLETLKSILEGVQRVPSLLLCNPKQTLESLNLGEYSVMPCEPLHDLKGHLNNIFEALPDILEPPFKEKIERVIEKTIAGKNGGHTGADLRVCAVRVLAALIEVSKAGCHVKKEVVQLMETVVKISEILYADESKRSSRQILQLYNCCWLHHELCLALFSHLTGTKFFGLYFHALLIHGPIQAEIANLRSLNTEAHERMFCSIKSVARSCTNCQPAYVMPRLLQCLQAKRIDKVHYKTSYSAQKQQDSRVAQDAEQLPPYKGTHLTKDFIRMRSNSFQAHLERISPYLECGPGIWWEVAGNIMFFDGDHHPNSHENGPRHMHYRRSDLNDVIHRSRETWRRIVQSNIKLPLSDSDIRLYSSSGDFAGYRLSNQATEQPSVLETEQSMSESAEGPVHDFLQCSQISHSFTDGDASNVDVTIGVEHFNVTLPVASTPTHQSTPALTSSNTANCEFELNNDDESYVVLQTDSPCQVSTMAVQVHSMEDERPINGLATKCAQEIANIIGDSTQLREFDKLRARLKAKKKSRLAFPATDYNRHETLLANLQMLVIASKNQLKKNLAIVESDHVRRYTTLPTDASYEKVYRKYRHACALLRQWSIAL